MKKRIITVLLVIVIWISWLAVSSYAEPAASITVSDSSCYSGNQTWIQINGNELRNLGSLDLEIYYDADAFQVRSTYLGYLVGNSVVAVNTNTAGVVKLSLVSLEGISGSGLLLEICLEADPECAIGEYKVSCAVGDAYGTDFSAQTITGGSGKITVQQYSPPTENYNLSYSFSNSVIKKDDRWTLELYSYDHPFASADFIIEYNPEHLKLENVSLSDGMTVEGAVYSVNTANSGSVRISYASVTEISPHYLLSLDFLVVADTDAYSDFKVTAQDVYKQDLTAYLNNTIEFSLLLEKKPEAIDYPNLWLRMPEHVSVGETFTTDLMLEKDNYVAAADFSIQYDPTVFRCKKVTAAEGLGTLGGMVVINPKYDNGKLRFSYVNEKAYSKTDFSVLTVTWEVLTAPKAHSKIILDGNGVCNTAFNDVTLDYQQGTCCVFSTELVEPNCTEQGYTLYKCSGCGNSKKDSYVDALDHNYNDGIVIKPPTKTEKGEMIFTCSRCSDSYTEEIPALSESTGCLKGDVDLDGEVNMNDFVALARHIGEVEFITDTVAMSNADVTGDSEVNMEDFVKLAQYIGEVIDHL